MAAKTLANRQPDPVKQFSVFTANRMGRLHDLVALLGKHSVHVLAMTVLDTTDSAILRFVVDDADQARMLLLEHGFPFTESIVLVVELNASDQLNELMSAFLEAELNINYLYSFMTQPQGKLLLALSLEDNDMAEQALTRRGFRVLRQSDVSR